MIKKVVVAAAGKGTRMLHLSQDKPKHLIEINGKPFLYYLLTNLKTAGFSEIIMVIGYQKKLMEEFLADYKDDFNLTIINQFELLDDKYGTACPIECVKDIIRPGESFISICGDNLYSVKDLKKFFIADDLNYVSGLVHPEPGKYGVLIKNGDDYLEKIIEKPTTFVGNVINTGLYKFTPEVFRCLPLIAKSARDEFEITDAINLLAKEKKVKIKQIEDYWLDFGKPEDVNTISEFLSNNQRTL